MANFPGVYPEIRELPAVISGISSSVVAVVGSAERGPVFERNFLGNFRNYNSTFGTPNLKYGYMGHCAAAFFETAREVYITRVVHDDATYAGVKIPMQSAGGGYSSGQGYSLDEVDTDLFTSVTNIGVSDGTTTNFNGILRTPFSPNTVVVIAGSVVAQDDGLGNLVGDGVTSGSVDYVTGLIEIVYTTSPSKGTSVSAQATDNASILAILADNPNQLDVRVQLQDATTLPANTLAAYTEGDPTSGLVTITTVNPHGMDVGDRVVVSNSTDSAYNGSWTVVSNGDVTSSYTNVVTDMVTALTNIGATWGAANIPLYLTYVYSVDTGYICTIENPTGITYQLEGTILNALGFKTGVYSEADLVGVSVTGDDVVSGLTIKVTQKALNSTMFTYNVIPDTITQVLPSATRWVQYPPLTDQRFNIQVYEVINGSNTLVETWANCTLFNNRINGSNTFVESRVNGRSTYIRVSVNQAALDLTNDYANPVFLSYAFPLQGGSNGSAVTSSDIANGWELYRKRNDVAINYMCNAGYVSEDDVLVQNTMKSIAESRRDCCAILDIPFNMTSNSPRQDAIDWRRNTQAFNSRKTRLYTPWIQVFDSFSNTSGVWLPPSGFVTQAYCRKPSPWDAAAGFDFGTLSSSVLPPTGLSENYDEESDGEQLYANGLNCILQFPSIGYVVWGQKTQVVGDNIFDRVNREETVTYIETVLRDAAKFNIFRANTPIVRAQIQEQFSTFLGTVGGLDRFAVDMSANTPEVVASNQMIIDLYLWLTSVAEVIRLRSNPLDGTVDITIGG